MYAKNLHLRTWGLLLAVMLTMPLGVARAAGWTETSIKSDVVTLDVERDGSAIVSHEIVMKVRGSPLNAFDVDGVDADAEPLSDATVAPASSAPAATSAIPLLLSKSDDGVLRVEVDNKKGLTRDTYLFKFRYKTNLLSANRLEPRGSQVELSWVGPRFADGIDSARVVFRLPPVATAPRLPESRRENAALAGEELEGTFLSNLRRAHDKDELEVIRPHVAKGEPVLWRVLVSAKAFDAFSVADVGPKSELSSPKELDRAPERLLGFGLLFALGLAYGALISVKWRATTRACKIYGATPRALVPLPALLRATLSGTALALAVGVGAYGNEPSIFGVLLVVAMALAVEKSPLPKQPLRGPGQWLPIKDEEAFAKKPSELKPGWLDTGSVGGFCLFASLLAGFVAGAVALLPRTPYHALMLLLGAACLLPIFCTGRFRELPADPVLGPRRLLSWLAERLRKINGLRVVPWARIPQGFGEPDELRLLVLPRSAKSGLFAIEVGLEYQYGAGGPVSLPCVIVRARDSSPSYQALPRDVVWTRGRKPEERVAVIRPKLPTRAMCLRLVARIADRLSDTQSAQRVTRQPAIRIPISRGSGSSTSKAGNASSPAQPT